MGAREVIFAGLTSLASLSAFSDNPPETLEEKCLISERSMIATNVRVQDYAGFNMIDYSPEEIAHVKALEQASWEEVQKQIDTPRKASLYCMLCLTHGGKDIDKERSVVGDDWMSGRRVHLMKVDDCEGGAMVWLSLLHDDGFPSYMLITQGYRLVHGGPRGAFIGKEEFCHAQAVYKTCEGTFGLGGINDLDNQPAIAHSIPQLLQLTNVGEEVIEAYEILDLGRAYPDKSFISGSGNFHIPLTLQRAQKIIRTAAEK